MNIYAIIPLVSAVAYIPLLALALRQRQRSLRRSFSLYLFSATVWSLGSFMLHANFLPHLAFFWTGFLTLALMWMWMNIFYFAQTFTGGTSRLAVTAGYLSLPVFAFAMNQGYLLKSAAVVDGVLVHDWGVSLLGLGLVSLAFAAGAAVLLGRHYRELQNPLSRTRVIYLLVGLGVLTLFALSNLVPLLAQFPVDHVGNLLNAILISYAILQDRLLEIHVVIRRVAGAGIALLTFLGVYFLSLFVLKASFDTGLDYTVLIPMTALFVVLMALLFRPLRRWVHQRVERLFFPGTYEYRKLLVTFTSRMGDVLDLDELASNMLSPISQALNSTRASLFLTDLQGDYVLRFDHPPGAQPDMREAKFQRDSPIVTWLTREGRALDRETIGIEAEFKSLWKAEQDSLERLDPVLLCPLRSPSSLVGILAVGRRASGDYYTADDIGLLMTMATGAAISVENARMFDELKKEQRRVTQLLSQTVRAQEEERQRVSVELHDTVAQWLVGASYRLQAFRPLLTNLKSEEALQELDEIEQTVQTSIKELRAVMVALHPPGLLEIGFVPALRKAVEDLEAEHVTGRLLLTGEPIRLIPEVELAVYRIMQEAINNIRKHSQAHSVDAHLTFTHDHLYLEIKDDGKGFDLGLALGTAPGASHMGLMGMRQRAEALGGTLRVRTDEGVGSTISLTLPLIGTVEELNQIRGSQGLPPTGSHDAAFDADGWEKKMGVASKRGSER